MKQDRDEDESPLHDDQCFAQTVDLVDDVLKGFDPVHNRRVGQQVNHHVKADRNQSAQRVQTANEKLMSQKKTLSGF